MRLLQNVFGYPAYLANRKAAFAGAKYFTARRDALVGDGFNGVHLLEPVVARNADAFFTSAADAELQSLWASENGLPKRTSPDDVLLSQVEHFRTEIFYTQNPSRYDAAFLKRLPGCVRRRVCWQSPPAPPSDLRGYDLVLNNFPRSLAEYGRQGVRTSYFTPSFDPVMSEYCDNGERSIDVAFVGVYSRHHRTRAEVLESVAAIEGINVRFALEPGRLTKLAEMPIGRCIPTLSKHARPRSVRVVAGPGVYGRAMYDLFSRAKIVLNGAVDSVAGDRGNMRCFEAMGCGALLLSDPGRYPEGMSDGRTMRIYDDATSVVARIRDVLSDETERKRIARAGLDLMRSRYSKAELWQRFQSLVA